MIDLYGCHISAKVIHTDQDSKINVQMVSSQCSENTSDISESVKVLVLNYSQKCESKLELHLLKIN